MLKKILAGSTAGVLALTAMASTAMAADNDTIVIESTGTWSTVTLDLTTKITTDSLIKLLGDTAGAVADPTDDKYNSYTNMVFSIWKNTPGNSSKLDSGKISADIKGYVQEYVTVPKDKVYYKEDGTTATVTAPGGENVAIGVKGGPCYNKLKADGTYESDPDNKPKGLSERTIDKDVDMGKDDKWDIKSVSPDNGFVTVPVPVQGTFNLSNNAQLDSVDFDKSSIVIDFTVTMDNADFKEMMKTAGSTADWDWGGEQWTPSYIESVLSSTEGKKTLNKYFGIAAEAGTYINNNYDRVGGVSQKDAEVEIKKVNDPQSGTYSNALPKKGTVPVGVAQNANLATLKNMNNGGTVTFEFDKAIKNLVTTSVVFYSTSGQMALPLNADFAFSEDGKTMTVDFPAGLTWSDQLNQYNSFKMMYEINDQFGSGVVDNTSGATNPDSNPNTNFAPNEKYDGKLIKITFKANAKAPENPNGGNSGGLVSDPASESDPTPSTPSNSGDNSGNKGDDNKNPSTGVAVAVAPVALAAVAAAVVISKKRK